MKKKTVNKKRKSDDIVCPSGLNYARLKWYKWVFLGLLLLIVLKCGYFWVTRNSILPNASPQWYRSTVDEAQRGEIVDANGQVLATSVTAYKVVICPNDIEKDDYDRIAKELSLCLDMDYDKVYKYVTNKVFDTPKSELILIRQISQEKANEIRELNLGTGVAIRKDLQRAYPRNSLLSQIIGYTNIDGQGQAGLELQMDKYLAGDDGLSVTDKSATGATLPYGNQEKIDTVEGSDVVLTVDVNIQSYLEKALDEALKVNNAKTAQGIIMNAKTGAIVAISSKPDFDLNNPPRNDATALDSLSRNRIVCDSYEPGSTFKIITLASGLDSGAINSNYSCTCGGSKEVSGQRIKCWRSQGHGQQTLTECAENSCNCAFMDIALRMGTDKFYEYIKAFGFGENTGSGMVGESAGLVSPAKGVQNTDLARIGFGQSIAVTPIQLATAVCAAVNGGKLMQPYIVDRIISQDGEVILQNEPNAVRTVISEKTSEKVREILESVVANGSGKNAKIAGYRIGGKTGTAQKYEDGAIADGKLIASFVGIAPINDPDYVCLILVDEPQVGTIFGSTVAAPFVKDVLQNVLEYGRYKKTEDTQTVKVPDLQGKKVADAVAKLESIGLSAEYQATDRIVNQVPAAGEVVPVGSSVLLYTEQTGILKEENTMEMPKLIGLSKYEAYELLKSMGLEMQVEGEYTGGPITRQYPYHGDEVEAGTVVTVKFN